MINSIVPNSQWMYTSSPAATYFSASGNNAGQMRFNFTHQCIEVCIGGSWQQLPSGVGAVDLSEQAKKIMFWAQERMNVEMQMEKLAAESPAIQDALKDYKIASERLATIVALATEKK